MYSEDEIRIVGSRFEHNRAILKHGGGVSAQGPVILIDGHFSHNKAVVGAGGGLFAFNALEIDGTRFSFNEAEIFGGGIYIGESAGASIANAFFNNNKSLEDDGGGIYARTNLLVNNVYFYANRAEQKGGGIATTQGSTTIMASEFINNEAVVNEGGGVFAQEAVSVAASHFSHNRSGLTGGGLYAQDSAIIRRNSFYENRANGNGSALLLAQVNGGQSEVVNNLWADNQGKSGPTTVICLLCDPASRGEVDVLHNTVVQTTPGQEQGIKIEGGTAKIFNNIIVNQSIGLRLENGTGSRGHNLYFGNDANANPGDLVTSTDIDGQDPLFIAPEVGHYLLQANSPAIGKALASESSALDQRGVHRAQGDGPDIGAFEYDEGFVPAEHVITIGCDTNELIEAIALANDQPGANRLELAPACTYTLIDEIGTFLGATGLPVITEQLIINGHDATIQRQGNATAEFRLLTVDYASLNVSDLTLQNGRSQADGGAIYAATSNSTSELLALNHVTVRDNTGNNEGGGVKVSGAMMRVEASHFINNQATEYGGGILADALQVRSSTFTNNSTRYNGGAIEASFSLQAIGNRFTGNRAESGAALDFSAYSPDQSGEIVNNLWIDNEVTAADDAIIFITNHGSVSTLHNTIVSSLPDKHIAYSVSGPGTTVFRNNIVSNYVNALRVGTDSTLISENNLFFGNEVTSLTTGNDNLNDNPLFVDPANGDFHLRSDSPARDNGLDVGVTVDLDGAARPFGKGFDIGAFEFNGSAPNPGGSFTVYLPLVLK